VAKLGILAGRGTLPAKVIERCRQTGREVFVVAFEGETDPLTVAGIPHFWTRLGAAAAIIDALRVQGVETLVLAGGIRRPSLGSLRPDIRGARFLAKVGLRVLGDDSLLSAVVKELEAEGFGLIGVDAVLTDAVAVIGSYGTCRPDEQAERDIARGLEVAHGLGRLDVGQAVIVQQGIVLGVEAIEGTDALIDRCAALRRDGPGGVLVKAKKPGQEARVDLPTIGPHTVERAAAAGLVGIAVEAGSSLVIDRETLITVADRLGLFVIGRAAER
jgi:DUF1009 family protein